MPVGGIAAGMGEDGRIAADVQVGENVEIGGDVTIGPGVIIHDNVKIGSGSFIAARTTIGEPLLDFYTDNEYENPPTEVGENALIRSGSVVYAGNIIGAGFHTGHGAIIREYCRFGDSCSFGTYSQADGHVEVGSHCRFHNGVFLASYTVIQDFVCFYPYAATLDSLHPPCGKCREGPHVESYAVVCAQALILPRVKIGRNAVIGAKALVVHDVPQDTVVAGVPARALGTADSIKCRMGRFDSAYPWQRNHPGSYPWDLEK